MKETAHYQANGFNKLFDEAQFPLLALALQTSAVRKTFRAGDTIVFQNEAIDRLGYLTEGEAEIEILSVDGEMLIAEKFVSGSLLNAVSFLDGKTSPATVVAVSECTVLFLAYSKLRSEANLEHEAKLLSGLCAAALYRMSEQLLSTSLLMPLKQRVLLRLQSLKQLDDEVLITAEKLAAYLAVSKHRVHRVLKELEKDSKIINTYGAVKLLDS
ncbi:hypothetical protein OAG1_03390 [Agarivorans sp. OAG1]|uniref:Crp/Fnr family transcriptional regulator n=1 Tax=Agarivorans sp. OAG1 TaxID=3082387 RepID=UPI002B297972|nr:hypothetical protein OAG1_03390 [Agarivorans sp. OAG1]